MAIRIDDEVLHTLTTERIMQNAADFASKSGGTIVPVTDYHQGDFLEDVFFTDIGGLERRDPTSNGDQTAGELNTATHREVKLYFTKLLTYKLTDIKRYGKDPDALQVKLGQLIGDAVTVGMLNNGLIGAAGALGNQMVTGTNGGTANFKALLEGLRVFGDNANAINAWTMASNEYYNLMSNGLDVNSDTVISGIVYDANPATLNRKAFVTDSEGLVGLGGGDTNAILGLTKGGVVVRESEEREIVTNVITGGENIVVEIQLEGAMTIGVKGYAYKTAAGMNPDKATLGAAGNWERVVSDVKATAGTMIEVKA